MVRSNSLVGRFPDVTLWPEEPEQPEKVEFEIEEVKEKKEKNGGRKWLRKICPCCCRQSSDEADNKRIVDTSVPEDKPSAAALETDGKKSSRGASWVM